jgi:WD40-like Beta Propeller Repeat
MVRTGWMGLKVGCSDRSHRVYDPRRPTQLVPAPRHQQGMHRRGSRITLLTGLAALTLSLLTSPAGAAFPDRNGRIVVPSNRSGNFELWTVKANGTGWRQLTNHPAFDACPAWSPDGTRLAFCSDRGGSL